MRSMSSLHLCSRVIGVLSQIGLALLLTLLAVPGAHAAVATPAMVPTTPPIGTSPIAAAPDDGPTQLVMQAMSLVGVKYKFGGNSPEGGFDCSGFVRHLFDTTLARALPRTSFEMSRLGSVVTAANLAPGDLVFYNTRKRAFSHVGIYIGEGRFIHSPSKGRAVEIVDMNDRYWQRRFNGAKRLLQTMMGPSLPPTD
jgi:cell wall-associated NlpC family hydrolase